MKSLIKRVCPFCKKTFETDNKQKKYCSAKCTCANYQAKIKSKKKTKNEGYFDWKDYKDLTF